jgi:CxxC motif-containing protein (DUF1111 family)
MRVTQLITSRRAGRWLVGFLLTASCGFGQTLVDPGVRVGSPAAGGPVSGLSTQEAKFFSDGLDRFQEIDSVKGTLPGTGKGLGPTFNLDSCSGCHAFPTVGGSSPAINPQVAAASRAGATNIIPFFITSNGPVREARFKSDGGVHALFTIKGRSDATGCNLAQPDFIAAQTAGNLVYRIPTPTFGNGLMEAISETAILNNKLSQTAAKTTLGIAGHENRTGNDGTITRFGWKAQNKSLVIFAGEAYNVEMGVTNEIFGTERDETAGCQFNPVPEDHTNYSQTQPQKISSDTVGFANFMRFLAPPTAVSSYGSVTSGSIANGSALFNSIGCALCHTPSLTTGQVNFGGLSGQTAHLFSDLLVHHMGTNLDDGISQGNAGPDEFRTAPLWGLGQRIFLLHDGRTSDLLDAINEHVSSGSEANAVISAFSGLRIDQRQDILNFLRSL